MTLTFQIWWGQLGRCKGIRVQPYFLETAYQWLKHFVYVQYGYMEWFEVNISLKHDVMASFSLHMGPWLPKQFWGQLGSVTAQWCPHIPMRQHNNGLNTCICLIWMFEVVWGGYQHQSWRNDITFTPQGTLTSQIWGQLGQCKCIRVLPYSLETAYQWLKHFVYIQYGCLKWSEVDISLNYDVMTSFLLHKCPWLPKSGVNLAGVMV